MKKNLQYPVDDHAGFRIKMLNWSKRFNIFCFLDNLSNQQGLPAFDCMLSAGARYALQTDAGNAFESLKDFYSRHPGWMFGHFGYDLKNETEDLVSEHPDHIGFPDLAFFVPEVVISLQTNAVHIYADNPDAVWKALLAAPEQAGGNVAISAAVKTRFTREEYVQTVEKLRKHILRGDCYEINFCQEFFIESCATDPVQVYIQLASVSPNPFAVLYRFGDRYCIGASPERYLQRTGDRLLSQPIKGTARRNRQDAALDHALKQSLQLSEKERSENVMVVDLVRNDLSKVCEKGTVRVDELFGIYSFPQVHQMISTVSGKPAGSLLWPDLVKATFPMGSMTGAPKKKVMQLIEQYERTRRGLFSGSVGYVAPNGDFDFNVVIRSILYNAATGYLSFQTGGAITFNSDAEKEYEECLLKAAAIMQVLNPL